MGNMKDALIALLGSFAGLSTAAAGYLWRAQRRNGNGGGMMKIHEEMVRLLRESLIIQNQILGIGTSNGKRLEDVYAELLRRSHREG